MADTVANTDAANASAGDTKGNDKSALVDAFREHFSGDAPFVDKVKSFAKARPWASAALAGVAGLLVLGSLKNRSR